MISREVGGGHEALDDPFQSKGIQYPAHGKSQIKIVHIPPKLTPHRQKIQKHFLNIVLL
jgi:hypothetical protein